MFTACPSTCVHQGTQMACPHHMLFLPGSGLLSYLLHYTAHPAAHLVQTYKLCQGRAPTASP